MSDKLDDKLDDKLVTWMFPLEESFVRFVIAVEPNEEEEEPIEAPALTQTHSPRSNQHKINQPILPPSTNMKRYPPWSVVDRRTMEKTRKMKAAMKK